MDDAKLHSKVRKLFALALDNRAPDAEAESSARKAIRACRTAKLSVEDLGAVLSPVTESRQQQRMWQPSPVDDLVSEAVRRGVDSLFSELAKGMKRR